MFMKSHNLMTRTLGSVNASADLLILTEHFTQYMEYLYYYSNSCSVVGTATCYGVDSPGLQSP